MNYVSIVLIFVFKVVSTRYSFKKKSSCSCWFIVIGKV